MYKILFFLHKTDDENLLNLFKEKIAGKLSEMADEVVETAEVDNNFLLDQKYSLYCEISADEREEMDKLMQTKEGKELSRALSELVNDITVIAVNYKK